MIAGWLRARPRLVGALVLGVLSACGHNSPTAPEIPTVPVPTGPRLLRITTAGQCAADGRPIFLLIYSPVTVARSGSGWIASATSPASGTVEVRFQQSRPVITGQSMPVSGTIRGVALHVPDLAPGPPMPNAGVDFGGDGQTALSGFAFAPSTLTPVAEVSGVGGGAITVTDSEGRTCQGSTFSWAVGPPGSGALER
jgi:hypothetical protein